MSTPAKAQSPSFDLLSQPARQRLRARVSDARGDLAAVREEIAAALTRLDQESAGANASTYQATRAFHVAQLTYLDHLAQSEQSGEPARAGGLWSRLRGAIGRT
jgi:hypothetical protein